MIQHPISIYSSQNPTHKPWAYGFIGAVIYSVFFLKNETKNLVQNPVSSDSLKKRYWSIMSDFRDAQDADKFIERVRLEFNNYFRLPCPKDCFFDYQDKSIPYFDLHLARYMAKAIYMWRSLHQNFYGLNKSGEEIPVFPNTRSGQWLKKYLQRRYGKYSIDPSYSSDYKSNKYWELVSGALSEDILRLNHYLQMLSRPDMAHARNINFNRGTIGNLIDRLDRTTSEIAAKTSRVEEAKLLGQQSPTEMFLKLSDGWKWVKILDPYNKKRDEVEATLMGHCAVPEWDKSHLISLRDSKERPWVTATIKDLSKTMSVIGQVKGRGNKKPPKKFEDQLLALFLMPNIIKHIPQDSSDWQMRDFETQNAELIDAKKPYFNNSKELPNYFNVKELVDYFHGYINSDTTDIYANGEIHFHVGKLREFLTEFFSSYSYLKQKTEYQWWANHLLNEQMYLDYDTPRSETAEWFIDEILNTKNGAIIYKALDKELQKEDQGFEDKDDYRTNVRDAFAYGLPLASELESAIDNSLRSSAEQSVFRELEKAFQYYLEKISEDLPEGYRLAFFHEDKEISVDEVFVHMNPRVYIIAHVTSLLAEDINPEAVENSLDQTLRDAIGENDRYWNRLELTDYSSEYALDIFNDHYLDDLVATAKGILKK